jgi:hypothetical protein
MAAGGKSVDDPPPTKWDYWNPGQERLVTPMVGSVFHNTNFSVPISLGSGERVWLVKLALRRRLFLILLLLLLSR